MLRGSHLFSPIRFRIAATDPPTRGRPRFRHPGSLGISAILAQNSVAFAVQQCTDSISTALNKVIKGRPVNGHLQSGGDRFSSELVRGEQTVILLRKLASEASR